MSIVEKQEALKSMHTKQILNLLRKSSLDGVCECCNHPDDIERLVEQRDILKEELKTREHIPNQIEAKEIRKQKSMKRKNLKNKKYVNRR